MDDVCHLVFWNAYADLAQSSYTFGLDNASMSYVLWPLSPQERRTYGIDISIES